MGYFNELEFGAPDVFLNAYFYEKSKDNKDALKKAKKDADKTRKNLSTFTRNVTALYSDEGKIPAQICINQNNINNSGLKTISRNITRNNDKQFNHSKAPAEHKMDFVCNSRKPRSITPLKSAVNVDTKPQNNNSKSSQSKAQFSKIENEVKTLCKSNNMNLNQTRFEKYEGEIGIYPIVLMLAFDVSTNKAVGILYYVSQGPNLCLTLAGSCEGRQDLNFELDEYDKGQYNGHFSFNYNWPKIKDDIEGRYGNIKNKKYVFKCKRIE